MVTRKTAARQWFCCLPACVWWVVYIFLVQKIFNFTFQYFQRGRDTHSKGQHTAQHNSTATQGSTAPRDTAKERANTTSTAKKQQSTTAKHQTTSQHYNTQHRGAGHHNKPDKPQGSRPRGQTGTTTPRHATKGQPRATSPSTAPQNTAGHGSTHSNTPQRQAPQTAQTTG